MNAKKTVKILCLTLGAMFYGVSANATITNIFGFVPEGQSSIATLTSQRFIRAGDVDAHFNLATFAINENVFGSGGNAGNTPSGIAWWDVVIQVVRDPAMRGDEIMAFDKSVLNLTNVPWTDFHMTVGTGIGDFFTESNETDRLFFQNSPAPQEESGIFANPPSFDENIPGGDNLWWVNGVQNPGIATDFWLSVSIPDQMFDPSGVATFTVREHASTVPEPTIFALFAIGLIGFCFAKRRKLSYSYLANHRILQNTSH